MAVKMNLKTIFLCVSIGAVVYFVLSFLLPDKGAQEILYWRAKFADLEKILKADEAKHRAAIEELEKKIAELNGAIDSSNTKLAEYEDLDKKKAGRIHELEVALNETRPLPEQIMNLKQQVRLWTERFDICQNVIVEKDKIIFSLTEKYETQVLITKNFEDLYLKTKANLETCRDGWNKTIRELGKCRSKVKINKLAVAGLGILGLALALKS